MPNTCSGVDASSNPATGSRKPGGFWWTGCLGFTSWKVAKSARTAVPARAITRRANASPPLTVPTAGHPYRFARAGSKPRGRGTRASLLSDEQRRHHERDGAEELDQHVEARPRGVLERVPDRVADDRRLVRLRPLPAVLPGLDELLRVVPG